MIEIISSNDGVDFGFAFNNKTKKRKERTEKTRPYKSMKVGDVVKLSGLTVDLRIIEQRYIHNYANMTKRSTEPKVFKSKTNDGILYVKRIL